MALVLSGKLTYNNFNEFYCANYNNATTSSLKYDFAQWCKMQGSLEDFDIEGYERFVARSVIILEESCGRLNSTNKNLNF